MKAYKGFNKEMCAEKYRHFVQGETYTDDDGFYAYAAPIDVIEYFSPGDSLYHEVELNDKNEISISLRNTKRQGRTLTVGKPMSFREIIDRQVEFIKNRGIDIAKYNGGSHVRSTGRYAVAVSKEPKEGLAIVESNYGGIALSEGNDSVSLAHGYCSVALADGAESIAVANGVKTVSYTNGNNNVSKTKENDSTAISEGERNISVARGEDSVAISNGSHSVAYVENKSKAFANGDRAVAIASGYDSLASANGRSCVAVSLGNSSAEATSVGGVAMALNGGKAKGCVGSVLFFVNKTLDGIIANFKSVYVDGEKIKEGYWYSLNANGDLVRLYYDDECY